MSEGRHGAFLVKEKARPHGGEEGPRPFLPRPSLSRINPNHKEVSYT
jgi:hypothetical protein